MFNLDDAIKDWRGRMARAGVRSSALLDELESHLREEFQNQLRADADANAERAFAAAAGRVGRGEQLKAEFAKVESARKVRECEKLRRWSVIGGVGFIYVMLFGSWYLGVRSGKLEISMVEVAFGVGLIVPIGIFGWVGRWLAKFLPVIHENWILAVVMGVLILGGALFRVCLPAIAPTNLVHLQIVILWGLSPLIGFGNCVSAWFARCAELRKKSA